MTTNNEMLARVDSYTRVYGRACRRCGQARPSRELNYEALVHHNAKQLECIDRQSCGRRTRKKDGKLLRLRR